MVPRCRNRFAAHARHIGNGEDHIQLGAILQFLHAAVGIGCVHPAIVAFRMLEKEVAARAAHDLISQFLGPVR